MREHRRRSLRLREYDYSRAGAYFVTICLQHHACLFGCVEQDEMRPNAAGEMIHSWWDRLPSKFPSVSCDAVIAMPNHLHGVLLRSHESQDTGPLANPVTLGDAMQWF